MEHFDSYAMIIAASVIILISFLFVAIAKRTNIPSVLLLIGLGVGIQYLLVYLEIESPNFFPVLEILGILGLIMIVLEAALDLKLSNDKIGTIFKSLLIALLGLGFSMYAASMILQYMIPGLTIAQSFLYATPLSILSSAIIIPSVDNLSQEKQEFHIYESTFSDIIGIMLFYFLISYFENEVSIAEGLPAGDPFGAFAMNLAITIAIAIVVSYLLLIVFQKIHEDAKLFVLISVLMLLYAIAKTFHLSPLIIILVFGLVVSNSKLFFRGPFKKILQPKKFKEMEHGLHLLTGETAFIVRTFFFVIFGATILITSLYNLEVLKISSMLIASIFIIRFILLRVFIGSDFSPQVWIAPRGLITVLLFYAIPVSFQSDLFDPGILLFIILATGILMTLGLVIDSISVEEEILNIEEKGLTPSIDPSVRRTKRWMIELKYSYKKRIHYPIIQTSAYQKTVKVLHTVFMRSTKALGVKPIFTRESKFLKQRLSTVIGIIRNPEGVTLEENKDYKALKKYVYGIMFETKTLEGILFDILIFTLIAISVAIVMILSVGGISVFWSRTLFTMEMVITIIFTVEYLLRVWTTKNSREYIFSTFGIVDFLAILPFFLELIFVNISTLGIIRLLRILRIFRVLKLARFIGEANILAKGVKANANKIFVFLFFVLIICTIMGSIMFLVEGPENGFTSIPRGVYWAVVTLTTVGYGDITPHTPIGQFISIIIMIIGYGVIAVPTGLVAAGVIDAAKENNTKKLDCHKCKSKDNPIDSNYCSVCGTDLT
ncbi:MAG: cell volume regulation protein A [Cyclobacteriaceae bacterium]|jgi:cell volume regulation protein A